MILVKSSHRKTNAVDGNTIPQLHILNHFGTINSQLSTANTADTAYLLNNTCKQSLTSEQHTPS